MIPGVTAVAGVQAVPPDVTGPTITSTASHSVAENAGYSATATASETVTWAKGGTDASLVTLNTSTGAWSVAAQNFETKPSVSFTLTATDTAGNASSPQTVTLTITNVNEAPTDISLSASTVAENAAVSTVVGALTRTDPDAGDSGTWSLTNDAGGKFAISGSNLVVNGALNFEAASSHSVTVRYTDTLGLTYDEAFTITVTNVNEAPLITSGSSFSVAEDTMAVATLTATDPDAGASLVWSLIGGADQAKFSITSGGVLTFQSAPNYEAPTDANADNVYLVQVQVSDGALTASQTISVTVTDVAEGATSYANSGGTGNRTSIIAGTNADTLFIGGHNVNDLLDGSMADVCWFINGNSNQWMQFDFGTAKTIDAFKWYQDISASHGTWKMQGSNNASTWTDLGSSFTLNGSSTGTEFTFSNSTAYRYYKLLQTAGTTSSANYTREIQFKIA